jgi:hypothetical protein
MLALKGARARYEAGEVTVAEIAKALGVGAWHHLPSAAGDALNGLSGAGLQRLVLVEVFIVFVGCIGVA